MKKMVLAVALAICFNAQAFAEQTQWSGTVVGISDGDTVKVLNEKKKPIKIRLVEIDAPEKNQAFGQQSKQSLSDICFNKQVVVSDNGQDKYKRTLGRLNCAGVDANAEQVKRGLAWAYRQYLTDPSIISLEDTAKASKAGLWADENPTPPWDFRRSKKQPVKTKVKASADDLDDILKDSGSSGNSSDCGAKSKCGEMNDCAEARHYLNDCGVGRLDRDKDGIPCESICN